MTKTLTEDQKQKYRKAFQALRLERTQKILELVRESGTGRVWGLPKIRPADIFVIASWFCTVLIVLTALIFPRRHPPPIERPHEFIWMIAVYEDIYWEFYGEYLPCKAYPEDIPGLQGESRPRRQRTDPDPNWETLGFHPDIVGNLFQFEVKVSDDKQGYEIIAARGQYKWIFEEGIGFILEGIL